MVPTASGSLHRGIDWPDHHPRKGGPSLEEDLPCRSKPKFSLLTIQAIIAAFAVGLWLARGWLYPNRVAGQRFALIGKIDINRDDRDDREELKRMIQQAGGFIDYDLPPVYVGKETGKISPRIDWFVTDDRIPLREVDRTRTEPLIFEYAKLSQHKGEVIKQARQDGIRPMPIQRLLTWLNGR